MEDLSNNIGVIKKVPFVFPVIVAGLFATYPFVFNRVISLPSIPIIMCVYFAIFFVMRIANKVQIPPKLTPLAVILSIGTIISLLTTLDLEYYKQVMYIWWGCVMIALIEGIGLKPFLFLYNRLILLIAVLGVLSFFLYVMLGDYSIIEFENMDGRAGWLTYFTFTNTKHAGFIRYSGVFDEPGAMASWGMFSLLLNKIYVKDSKIEKPLIICLFFTFSIAYIIQISLYYLFFYLKKTKMSTQIASLSIIILLVSIFIHFINHDYMVYMWTLGRLGIGTSIDFFKENNRVKMMERAYEIFKENPLFGIGLTKFYNGEYAADNPYETLAKDGIIGTFFLYLPLLKALKYAKQQKEILYMIIILVVGYLQRPFHINILHYTMIFLVFVVSYKSAMCNSYSIKS